MAPFIDYIPDGQTQGAQGKGFIDFVPDSEPVLHEEVKEEVVSEPETSVSVEEPKKKGKKTK